MLAVEAVDARGRVVRIDRQRNADLFEGLSAGVAPVIVTAVTLQLHPLAEIWAGGLMWPLDRAADVVHAWHAWIGVVPDTVTSLVRVLLAELSEAAVAGFVDAALAPASDALLSVELRHLGGALAPDVPGDALAFAVGIVPVPEAVPEVAAAARAFARALAPYAAPRAMKNFTERPGDPERIYGSDLARLRTIVAAWDPEQVIAAGHPVLD